MTGRGQGIAERSARDVARRVLRRVRADQAFTSLALDAELSRADLPERERKLATELCYGVCRHMSRLDRAIASAASRGKVKVKPAVRAALRVGAYQLLFLDRVPDHAAVDDAVNAARRAGGAQVAGFANSLLRRLAREGEPALPDSARPLEYVRVAHSLPEWIAERLATSLGRGEELLAAAAAFHQRPPLTLRVNRTRVEVSELAEILRIEKPGCIVTRSDYSQDALLVQGLGDPLRSPSFERGLWTVQDVGAQLITAFLGDLSPVSGQTGGDSDGDSTDSADGASDNWPQILDACAGVGGKTLHLAERVAGRIDAADVSAAKLARLTRAAERLGSSARIRTIVTDLAVPDAGQDELAAHYDRVLLDAPCTGLGVMRRHPEIKWRVEAGDVARIAETQRALLDRVCEHVRPGGVLVYGVCTFTYEEGPGQIRQFLTRHPEFSLEAPAPLNAHESDGDAARATGPWPELAARLTAGAPASPGTLATWPHRHNADAFFAARMRRRLPEE